MLKPLVLYGAGGMGREVAPIVEAINAREPTFDFLGFVVSPEYYSEGATVNGIPIVGDEEWLLEHSGQVSCTCTIGEPRVRSKIQRRLMNAGVSFESLIDPSVWVPESVSVGRGVIAYCDVRISANCVIEDGAFFNCGVTLGHDVFVGEYACIMPGSGVSGGCVIGARAFLGGHSFVVEGKRIGPDATVAAGGIVFGNVKAGTVVLGNPAKRMKCLEG